MSETPWTPGPWRVVGDVADFGRGRAGHGHLYLEDILSVPTGTHVVCFGHDYDDTADIRTAASWRAANVGDAEGTPAELEYRANARLIAKAPEMAQYLHHALLLGPRRMAHAHGWFVSTAELLKDIKGERP